MRTIWTVALLGTSVAVLFMTFVFSGMYLLFSLTFSAIFLLMVLIAAFQSSIQADATPGIETIGEPDFFFSPIFFAWLYVNDRERWARYVVIISHLFAVFLGSIVWSALFIEAVVIDPSNLVGSWLIGVLWLTIVTIGVKTRISPTETESRRIEE